MQKYKLAVAASATAYDALEELDRIVQAYYDEGYAGEHKAQLYQSPCGGLHVAYKELVKYEPEPEPEDKGVNWFTTRTTREIMEPA